MHPLDPPALTVGSKVKGYTESRKGQLQLVGQDEILAPGLAKTS